MTRENLVDKIVSALEKEEDIKIVNVWRHVGRIDVKVDDTVEHTILIGLGW